MNQEKKLKYLKGALYIVGAFFVIGVPFMMAGLSSHAWHWTPRQPEYEQMIMGIYAVLGVFDPGCQGSAKKYDAYLVHNLVKHSSWRHYACPSYP